MNSLESRRLRNGVRKNGVRNRVRIDDVWSILKFRIGFPFGENSAGFCRSMWLPGSIPNFRIGSVSSIGGLIAATLFAAKNTMFKGFGASKIALTKAHC